MAAIETIKNIIKDFVDAFDITIGKTYVPDGYDLNKNRYITVKNEFIWVLEPRAERFKNNSLTKASTFFGFSNRDLSKNLSNNTYKTELDVAQSLINIGKNFIGWQEDVTTARLIINILILTPLNLILTPLRLLQNLLKIVTEVIPGTLAEFTDKQFKKSLADAKSLYENKKYILLSFYFPTVLTRLIFKSLFQFAYWIGCALTSPIDTIKSAWNVGAKQPPFNNSSINKYIFAFAAAFGVAVIYTLAFPIAIKALTLSIAPVISQHLPVLMNVIDKIANAIPPAFSSIGNFIINHVSYISLPAKMLQISSILSAMPAAVALGSFVGLGLAIIGPPVDMALDKFKKWWHTSSEKTAAVNENANNDHHVTYTGNSYSRVPGIKNAPTNAFRSDSRYSTYKSHDTRESYDTGASAKSHGVKIDRKNSNPPGKDSYEHALFQGDAEVRDPSSRSDMRPK